MAEELGSPFRRGVGREGAIHDALLHEGHLLCTAVDAGRRGQHEFGHLAGSARVEQVQCSDEVGFVKDPRVHNTVTDSGASSQIDDCIDGEFGEQVGEGLAVRDVDAPKRETWAVLESCEPPLLEAWIISVVEVVDPENVLPAGQQ